MHIARMDRDLYQLIKNRKVTNITILSRYNTSMSGYSNGYFITILNETKDLLPMSLVLSGRIDEVHLQKDKEVAIFNNESSNLYYDERTTIEGLRVEKDQSSNLSKQLLEKLFLFFQESKLKDGFYPLLSRSYILNLPQKTVNQGLGSDTFFLEKLNLFLNGLKNRELNTALNIIGYGPGLTPSSDDFLLGLLSAFLSTGDDRYKTLCEYINLHKEKTTEVSKWMLHYATNRQLFPYIIKKLYQTKGRNFEEFLTHGATSGMDLLCGIYTGLFLTIHEEVGNWEIES